MRAIVFFLLLSGAAWGQVVFHDGFEVPALAATAWNVTGSFTFGVWSGFSPGNGGNAGFVRDGADGLTPPEGVAAFAFNGANPPAGGWIETSLATQAGASYQLSFALGRGPVTGQLLHAKVEAFDPAGVHVLEEMAIPAQVVAWSDFAFAFTADAAITRIRFTDVSGPNQVSDLWLDNVTVTQTGAAGAGVSASAVPEPGDWACYAGFAALGIARVRRKRRREDRAEGKQPLTFTNETLTGGPLTREPLTNTERHLIEPRRTTNFH